MVNFQGWNEGDICRCVWVYAHECAEATGVFSTLFTSILCLVHFRKSILHSLEQGRQPVNPINPDCASDTAVTGAQNRRVWIHVITAVQEVFSPTKSPPKTSKVFSVSSRYFLNYMRTMKENQKTFSLTETLLSL